MHVPDGSYRAYGQKLTLQKGLLSFNGPVENPLVELRAVRVNNKEKKSTIAKSLNISRETLYQYLRK